MRRLLIPAQPDRLRPVRAAFTLVELVVVIAIIAILVALLVPTLISAFVTVKVADVSTEIKDLESGLTQFQAKYGFYPPTTITLQESGSATWDNASRATIRRMFSKFNFGMSRDINGNGTTTDVITLTGPQCLVFFLGGLYRGGAMIGFSKNPLDPFNASGTKREGPYTEFDPSRLVVNSANGMPVYLDPFAQDAPTVTKNPYSYINANDYSGTAAYHTPGGAYYKPQSYQIVSPGADGEYTGPPASPAPTLTYDADKTSTLAGNRANEQDNITNFHSGVLAPK